MSRPRFLADNDLNDYVITGLLRREPAIEFLRVRDVGLERSPDPVVLEYASRERFIIVSHDVNSMSAYAYQRIATGSPMTGLFLVRQTDPVMPVIEELILIWSASEAEEWVGIVEFLPM